MNIHKLLCVNVDKSAIQEEVLALFIERFHLKTINLMQS